MATADAQALAQLIGAAGNTPLPAWQHLLALWRLPADRITVDASGPCLPVAPDVHCVQGRVERLDALLALDRPLLLRLREPGSTRAGGAATAWALLLGADARQARVRIGARTVDIDRRLLQSRWDGGYAALWQGPALLATPPREGSSGPAVDWLRARLLPDAAARPGQTYDAALRTEVAALQVARGLPADGIAGPLTLMALASDLPGPRLLRNLDANR